MTNQTIKFHPGIILHDVIIGALRSSGSSLDGWCQANQVRSTTARSVTLGTSTGPKGTEMLNKIIDDAGRDIVTAAYTKRMVMEAEKLKAVA